MSIEVRGKENIVPIDMRVKVTNSHGEFEVSYEKCKDEFAYEFRVFPKTNGALEAVKEIICAMENQSYDHGASWRMTDIEEVNREDKLDMYRFFKAHFRIRDAW